MNQNSAFTANKLMLGRWVNTPADLLYLQTGELVDVEAYVVDIEQGLQIADETARGRLCTSEKRIKRDYDLNVYSRAYEEGDLVDILDTPTVKGKCCKVSPSLKGTDIVIRKLYPYLYRVKTKAAVMVANHNRLKKCVDRAVAVLLPRKVSGAKAGTELQTAHKTARRRFHTSEETLAGIHKTS